MRKHFYLLAVVTCGWISMLTTVGIGHPQGRQAPAPAPPTAPTQQPTAPAAGQPGFVPGTNGQSGVNVQACALTAFVIPVAG